MSAANITIRTSSANWLADLAKAYQSRATIYLLDDANLGVDPINQTILDMGRKANLSQREWIAVLVSLGISSAGAYLLVMAILDPEPYSKIGLAIGSGALLIAGGGFSAIRILVGHKPPNIEMSLNKGFKISFT
ncbi:hypothetical protein [Hydrogenophaga sp. MI9]|uniref:hypothetical protein n=1 Tax=Hydrogenophaga sp. MI9 TaxID=3453719 RepID=UPI003EEB5C9E